MGGKILQKWGLQPPFNPYIYLIGRVCTKSYFNPLSANPTKWPNTQTKIHEQIVDKLFEHVWPLCEVTIWWHYTICVPLKKISKASTIFSVYIHHLLSKYWKKTMFNLKTSKNLIKWTFFKVLHSKVAF